MTSGLLPEQQWKPARHLTYLARVVREAILKGDGRIIVTMPPRHGKSLLISWWLPIWFLELWPHREIILASYAANFAAEWGRKVRNTIEQNDGDNLTVRVAQDSSAADRWHTSEGGGMVTAGIGVGIAGRGAHLFICDDAAAKDEKQAASNAWRETVWSWYTSSARPRLAPHATVIHVQTRWHEDDLAGRLLRNDEGEGWVHVNFPAIAEEHDILGRIPGEPLWPERFGLESLNQTRRTIGSYMWAALYQQHPTPEGGELFKRTDFRYFRDDGDAWLLYRPDEGNERIPKAACQIAQTCDTAVSEKKTSDWTVVFTFAQTPKRELLVLDVTRVRLPVPDQLPLLKKCRARWNPTWQGVEDKGGGMAVIQYAKRDGYPLRPLKPGLLDKRARAFDAIAMYENGMVYHAQDAPWLADFEGELLTFDRGEHDDQVDALAYAAASMRRPEPRIIGL